MTKNPKTKLNNNNSLKLKRYICYYYILNDDGERIMIFKEWGDFINKNEAISEFRDRYPNDKKYEIGYIEETK